MRFLIPSLDADPNRGLTAGVMPVWVMLSSGSLRQLHIPSLTYNAAVGAAAAWDYYLFPSTGAHLELFGSIAQRSDRELYAECQSPSLGNRGISLEASAQVLRDAGRRFYGTGPRSGLDGETDFTLSSLNYSAAALIPWAPGSPWAVRAGHHVQVVRILPGPQRGLPDVESKHPGASGGRLSRIDAAFRAGFGYDSRDSAATASRGLFAESFIEAARDGWLSDMTYERYGFEVKAYAPYTFPGRREPHVIAAFHVRAELLQGHVPFWTLPALGGKYSQRAYGQGRFIDRLAASVAAEVRLRVFKLWVSGTPVSFWLDPFVGGGEVAPSLGRAEARAFRPVYGASLRAVVRPHVVGSADFGVGQEGPKVFLDLNYAF